MTLLGQMPIWLIVPAVTFVLLMLWAFRWAPQSKKDPLASANDVTGAVAHSVTAIAILTAGLFYLFERQWSPRFAVDVAATAKIVPDVQPKTALVHVAITITNQGRTTQRVNFIEVGAVGLKGQVAPDPRWPHEIAGTPFDSALRTLSNTIDSGEIDTVYVDVPVACEWELIRVIVKVPKPPVEGPEIKGPRPVYERQLLVDLGNLCRGA